jgi:nesprin-1
LIVFLPIHRVRVIADEQERVQKKTFVNWINSYLSKVNIGTTVTLFHRLMPFVSQFACFVDGGPQRVPPLRVDDLIEDLKDGTKLIALLEVLANTKLVRWYNLDISCP